MKSATTKSASPPTKELVVRMVNGGTSLSAIRMIGQVTPQTTHSTTSRSFAVVSSAGLATRSGFLTVCSRLLRSGAKIPIEDLLTCPEQDILLFAEMFDDTTEIFQPVRRAHDVGMERDRHHPR